MVLNFLFFLHSFTFCVQCLLGGHHHPPHCTGAQELRSCAEWLEVFLRQRCQVCELRTADQGAFYT